MKVYVLGFHDPSTTTGDAAAIDYPDRLITVEVLPGLTDMQPFSIKEGMRLYSPYYLQYPLNCGRVVDITDMLEQREYSRATFINGNQEYVVKKGQYFACTDGIISSFAFKIAALEYTTTMGATYTGVRYKHYSNGLIKTKAYYVSGDLDTMFRYRDDMFNTLESVSLFNGNQLYGEFRYDAVENLTEQLWYNSDTSVHTRTLRVPRSKLNAGKDHVIVNINEPGNVGIIEEEGTVNSTDDDTADGIDEAVNETVNETVDGAIDGAVDAVVLNHLNESTA